MNAKDTILNNDVIAYCSALGGVEVHNIQYSINDYVYCTCNAWCGRKSYHRVKIHYDAKIPYIILYGYRLKLDDFIRCN